MTIVGIDPSLTCTGIVAIDGDDLLSAERIVSRIKGPPVLRVDDIVWDVIDFLSDHNPDAIGIETPSGRPGAGIARGAGARLALWGMGVGSIRQACLNWCVGKARLGGKCVVYSPTERDWTGRRTKAKRAIEARMLFPSLSGIRDPGGDVTDAAMIAVWTRARHEREATK